MSSTSSDTRFQPGATVIYPLHGKCTLLAIEERNIDGQQKTFYKLEIQRSTFSRSTRQEPAIWVPVQTAHERGLRAPIGAADTDAIYNILSDKEYYFDPNENWGALAPKLEAAIRAEGAYGLAKALCCLSVIRRKMTLPPSEVNRMFENTQKALAREISDVTQETLREIEMKFAKALKNKTLTSH